jgi:hypothetical protein
MEKEGKEREEDEQTRRLGGLPWKDGRGQRGEKKLNYV